MDPTDGKGPSFDTQNSSAEQYPSIDMSDDAYCFKTDFIDGSYGVRSVLEDSRYFERVESTDVEAKYESPGVNVRVDEVKGAVEYAVYGFGQEHGRAVQEFVEGVIHAIEDVNPEFQEEIEEEIYNRVIADGGYKEGQETLADIDHGTYDKVQETMERGADVEDEYDGEDEPDVMPDGGRQTIPYGGMPSSSEVRRSEDQEGSMPERPM